MENAEKSILSRIATELSLSENRIQTVSDLLDEGGTIPFIARYRKERTGELNEIQLISIRDRLQQLKDLEKRREAILKSIEEQGKLTTELKKDILEATLMARLEDLYLPYRPKKRTRATIAIEKGLEPLAKDIFKGNLKGDLTQTAKSFIDTDKDVADVEEALSGARDIIAEWISEDTRSRDTVRRQFERQAQLASSVKRGKKEAGEKYKDYFDWSESASRAPSHRLLALFRGEKEGFLKVKIQPDNKECVEILQRLYQNKNFIPKDCQKQIDLATIDASGRLIIPSLESEWKKMLKEKADIEAVNIFSANLRELLMSSPLGPKNTLGLDPGFRTGCKLVCLDRTGALLHDTVIFPTAPHNKTEEAGKIVKELCKKYNIEAIAVGNGTAGRETFSFVRSLGLDSSILSVMVNESGASIYSASEIARKEFPNKDLTVRGAVSIGRRLMDPLSELVKIDPKSIGVGQYQHDVDQKLLQGSLDDTVVSCVNAVGVDLNTASGELLKNVSGLTGRTASAVVDYRLKNGAFKTRKQLLKVPGMGPKSYEQSAGFLRIRNGSNPLDGSAVHPEAYTVVEAMAKDLKCDLSQLMGDPAIRKKIDLNQYSSESFGLLTLKDILTELEKPGRDPRSDFEAIEFREDVNSIEDLTEGMVLEGVVTNVAAFGAFVDIGVHQDGLVHISQVSDRFIQNIHEVVKVGQKVSVTVTGVEVGRKRIGLSMKGGEN